IPMLYPNIEEIINIVIQQKDPIVFTTAGNPKTYTQRLQSHGIKVAHVVSSEKSAMKAEERSVDAIVDEGFEAGVHNGREETTTLTLIPMVAKAIQTPLLAAGGIATGQSMLAVMLLGADGVQVGSRFVASEESSAHQNFKQRVVEAKEGDTILTLKELAPVRLIKNKFYEEIEELYQQSPSREQLVELLGRARAKRGMFEGDLEQGELEIGQVSSQLDSILPAGEIVENMMKEFSEATDRAAGFYIDILNHLINQDGVFEFFLKLRPLSISQF